MQKEKQAINFKETKKQNQPIFVLDKPADLSTSMKILDQNKFRPLTYSEALSTISTNKELRRHLDGKWFFLGQKKLNGRGTYSFNEKGELLNLNPDDMWKPEKIVEVFNGKSQLRFGVNYHEFVMSWYTINATQCSLSSKVAPVIIGTREIHSANQGQNDSYADMLQDQIRG